MTGIKPSKEHFRILDGIRGVAILLVMLFHVEGLLPSSRYFFVLHKMAWFGWTGVDLFFVLSGFLITGILLDTKHAANYFGSFYARRVLRIFPLYYGALTAIVILSHFSYTVQSQLPPHIACDFLYVSNWTDPFTPITKLGLTGHFWTLAVEEQFYLLWPFCVWMAEPKRLRMACIYGVLIACGLRCAMVIGSINQDLIYKALFTRMDTLLVGALVAIAI